MVQSVELLIDEAADAAIRRQWALLRDAGIPSMADVRSDTNRPHITLGVADEISPRIDSRVESGANFTPIPLRLGGVIVFGGRRAVIARLVVPSAPLLSLQQRVYELLSSCPHQPVHTRPGHWTPHVTLARRIDPEVLGTAIAALRSEPEISAIAVGVRRWDGTARREWRIA